MKRLRGPQPLRPTNRPPAERHPAGKPARTGKSPPRAPDVHADDPVRSRVMGAAFSAFMERGYEGASTLDIATRARVSKRELYALFDNKHAMLAACIAERTKLMRLPLELTAPRDVDALAGTLATFGAAVLRVVCHPAALAVFFGRPRFAHHTIQRRPP